MRELFMRIRKSESGATLVEYGIAMIVAIIVGGTALVTLAGGVNTNLDNACDVTKDVTQIGAGTGVTC